MPRPPRGWLSLAVGLAAGVLALAVGAVVLEPADVPACVALAILMGAIAAEDLRDLRVPDPLVLVAILAGYAAVWLETSRSELDPAAPLIAATVQMLICGAALYALREVFYRLRGTDGLGLGDVKLAAAAGIWIGWQLFAFAVLFAAIAALFGIAGQSFRGTWSRGRMVPLAFYLAPAIWLCWLLERAEMLG